MHIVLKVGHLLLPLLTPSLAEDPALGHLDFQISESLLCKAPRRVRVAFVKFVKNGLKLYYCRCLLVPAQRTELP